jgi:hypothetical protein
MDGSQFDAWTRRGFGAAAGGLAGSLLALSAIPSAEAKKKNKKKKNKCLKLNDKCNDNKKKCCCGYECQPVNASGNFCCRAAGFPADSAEDCCSGRPLELGKCICKTLGQGCGAGRECCSGFCVSGTCDDSPPPPP